jgi:hypothetical protein
MLSAGFESAIPAIECQQTCFLDGRASEIERFVLGRGIFDYLNAGSWEKTAKYLHIR